MRRRILAQQSEAKEPAGSNETMTAGNESAGGGEGTESSKPRERTPERDLAAIAETSEALNAELSKKDPKPARESSDLELGQGVERIVKSVFDLPDTFAEYEAVRAWIRSKRPASSLSLGKIIDLVDESSDMVQRANELLAIAKSVHDDFEVAASVTIGAMHERAVELLLDEKDARKREGKSTKTTNKDDVALACAQYFPDEWVDVQQRRSRAKHAIRACESLADQCAERQRDLRVILTRAKGE